MASNASCRLLDIRKLAADGLRTFQRQQSRQGQRQSRLYFALRHDDKTAAALSEARAQASMSVGFVPARIRLCESCATDDRHCSGPLQTEAGHQTETNAIHRLVTLDAGDEKHIFCRIPAPLAIHGRKGLRLRARHEQPGWMRITGQEAVESRSRKADSSSGARWIVLTHGIER